MTKQGEFGRRFFVFNDMVDTVVLLLEAGKFMICEPEKFDPVAYWCSPVKSPYSYSLGNNKYQALRSYQRPTPKELSDGKYKPRLTLFKGFSQKGIRTTLLKIEVSLPKLLFGNNFNELKNSDFEVVVEKLLLVLKEMRVSITEHNLRYADVCAIHYSKNVVLDGYTTSNEIIKEFGKGDYSLMQDLEKVMYRNGGHLFKLHTNSWEFAAYDKVKDLQQAKISEKRSEEKDNQLQLNFLDKIKAMPTLEVLRLEARLNKKVVIKNILKKLNISCEVRFKDLYNKQLSQQVLLYHLQDLKKRRHDLLDYKPTKNNFTLTEFMVDNPNLKLREQILFYGFMKALQSQDMREIKASLKNDKDRRSWYRFLRKTKKLHLPQKKNFFDYLESNLLEFKPLSVDSIKENYYQYL